MRAARYYDRGDIRIEDVPEPVVAPGTVGIDVAFCGICGTDLHEYLEGPLMIPPAGCPHPVSGECAPITIGHEFSGVIYALGEGVTDLTVGERVTVEPFIMPEEADTGPGATYNSFPGNSSIGLGGGGGGLSEKIAVPRRWVHPVGDMPLEQAALLEPLSVAYHACERSGVQPGMTALVAGGGPIGLLTSAVLTAQGVTVIMSEPSAMRRTKALDVGAAKIAFDPRETDVAAAVKKLTDKGVDVSFEATSNQHALDTLVDATRSRGVLVIIAIWSRKAEVDLHQVVRKEIDVRGTFCYANNHPAVIKMVQDGKINLAPFITGVIGLDALVSEGYETLIHRNETAVKILVDPRK